MKGNRTTVANSYSSVQLKLVGNNTIIKINFQHCRTICRLFFLTPSYVNNETETTSIRNHKYIS